MEKCTEHITMKVSAEFKKQMELYARTNQRTVSNMMKVMALEYIKNHPLTPPLSEGEEKE